MPDVSVKSYLSSDEYTMRDVPSKKHPDGKAYTVTAPSAADEMLMRRLVQLQDRLSPLLPKPGYVPQTAKEKAEAAQLAEAARPIQAEIAACITQLCLDEDGNEVDYDAKLLSGAYEEMVADGVRPRHLTELASLVMTNYGTSEHIAQMVLDRAEGEALARGNRATRRAAATSSPRKARASKPRAGSKSSRTSGAKNTQATRARASTRGRKTSAAAPEAKTA